MSASPQIHLVQLVIGGAQSPGVISDHHSGIVVNNAILLVEYTKAYPQRRGAAVEQAIVDAGAVRLRPILMTTLATLCGMLPLALGRP